MLVAIGAKARGWARSTTPWTNVIGVARSLLAGSTAMTLLFTPVHGLFMPASGQLEVPVCSGVHGIGGFCVAGASHLEAARWIAIIALLIVASGYRPRITGVIHWWISVSLMLNAVAVDGGDSVAAVLTFLLLPVTLTDPRKWHWQALPPSEPTRLQEMSRLLALTALTLIRLQVCGIYFHASIAKFGVEDWGNGTALYYFLLNPQFGVAEWVRPILRPILLNGTTLALMTWSVLVLEYSLSAGIFVTKSRRGWLLAGGIALHAMIMVTQGLTSFSLNMFAALILYLRPIDQPFAIPTLGQVRAFVNQRLTRAYAGARSHGALSSR